MSKKVSVALEVPLSVYARIVSQKGVTHNAYFVLFGAIQQQPVVKVKTEWLFIRTEKLYYRVQI